MQWFYKLARTVCHIIFSILHDIRYENTENIPREGGGYIVACNHTSYSDPLMIAFKQPRWIRYMAKEELTGIKGLGWLFRWLGIIPVSRGSADMSAIEGCARVIKEGHILGIFPEGTRYPHGQPGRPKSGMALIARMTGADILPCCVIYEQPKKFRSRVTVKYGKLIPAAELGLSEDSPRALKRATKLVWGEILDLLGMESESE